MIVDKSVAVDKNTIEQLISDELELKTSEYGTEITVEISDSSIDDAASAVMYEIEQQWPEPSVDDSILVAALRVKQAEFENSVTYLRKSGFALDLARAFRDMEIASFIKNFLSEHVEDEA